MFWKGASRTLPKSKSKPFVTILVVDRNLEIAPVNTINRMRQSFHF